MKVHIAYIVIGCESLNRAALVGYQLRYQIQWPYPRLLQWPNKEFNHPCGCYGNSIHAGAGAAIFGLKPL